MFRDRKDLKPPAEIERTRCPGSRLEATAGLVKKASKKNINLDNKNPFQI